jgi:sortase A
MGVDRGALVPLVLWLQVLIAAAVGATWAQARWGGAQTWLVGLPVLLLGAWEVADSAMQLLPNLL